MRKKLLILLLVFPWYLCSQEIVERKLLSDVVGQNIREYKKKAKIAILHKDYERAQFLFDSIVRDVINGSYLDNFRVRRSSGRRFELHRFDKPIFMITSASWVATGPGEIPALNSIADEYSEQIDFLVLFWGPKKKLRKLKKKYSKNICILFVNERENTNDHTIRSLKHSLGFPTSFLISDTKEVLDVRRNVQHPYSKDFTKSYNRHYQAFMGSLSVLLQVETDSTSAPNQMND